MWLRPRAESIPAAEKIAVTVPVITMTPVAAVQGHSRCLRDEADRCATTSEDEQAVSTVRHGPVSPSVYDTRPDNTESAPEVPVYEAGASSRAGVGFGGPPSAEMVPPAPRKKPTSVFSIISRQPAPSESQKEL